MRKGIKLSLISLIQLKKWKHKNICVINAVMFTQRNVYFCDNPLIWNRSLISKIVTLMLSFFCLESYFVVFWTKKQRSWRESEGNGSHLFLMQSPSLSMDNELYKEWVLPYIEREADLLSKNHKWAKAVFLVIFYLNAKCLLW